MLSEKSSIALFRRRLVASVLLPSGVFCLALIIALTLLGYLWKANRAVILFLSAWLDVPRSAVSLLRGESARLKVVELPDGCAEKLARLLPAAGVPEA